MGVLTTNLGTLLQYYPTRTPKGDLYQTIAGIMSYTPGTPCCVQMSYALNKAGILLPARSWRRNNAASTDLSNTDDGTTYYFTLAVDELEKFLYDTTGDDGELLSVDSSSGERRSGAAIMSYISGRPGILTFRSSDLLQYGKPGVFEHTEIWNGQRMWQTDMSTGLFNSNYVRIWDTNDPPTWLTNYMATS